MERYFRKLPNKVSTNKPSSSEGILEPVPKDSSSTSLKDVSDIPAKKLKRIEDDELKNPIPSTSASRPLPLSIEEEELDLHLEEIGNAGENVKSSVSKGAQPKSKRPPNKFVSSWLQIPEFKGWLEKSKQMKADNEQGYCKLCFCNLVAHKVDLQRHAKSEKHKAAFSQISGSKTIDSMMKYSLSTNVKRAEIKLAGLIACNNLPFSLMDTLVPLIGDICPDSEIAQSMKSKRKKTTAVVKESLGDCYRKTLNTTLAKPGCFFSIIMDETTDRGSVKQCAFTVIYYDEQRGSPKCKFFDMVETPSGTAVDLTNCLKETFSKHQVPLENLVGFSSDTTNVMFGENHSVVSLLKSEFPNVAFVKCSCHMVHLVASKACLKLPRSLEDLLRNVGAHFSRSYSRQVAFKEFQEFFQVEMLKILSPSTTRWLSLSACVNRVLGQYTALQHYFRETCFEDPSKTLDDIAATLENVFTIVYLEFLSYALGLLTEFNEMFQSEHPLLHKLKPEVMKLLRNVCLNYMIREEIKDKNLYEVNHEDPTKFIPLEKLYIGLPAHESLQNLKKDSNVLHANIVKFMETCRSFYIETVTQIKKKFSFEDPLFQIVEVVDPEKAQSFTIKSLQPVVNRFPILSTVVDYKKLDQEWREHALLNYEELDLVPPPPADVYWEKVGKMKSPAGVPLFLNVKKVMELLLVLPFSNATVERLFSKLNNIKTFHRNKLKTNTIVSLIIAQEGIEEEGGCLTFEPTKEMLKKRIWQ